MKKPTRKQLEMLQALNPLKADANETFKQAANELDISKSSLYDRMLRLKQRCPEVYGRFRELRKGINRTKRRLRNSVLLDPKIIEQLEQQDKIKEIF